MEVALAVQALVILLLVQHLLASRR